MDIDVETTVEWQCKFCTLLNPGNLISCGACEALRPEAVRRFSEDADGSEVGEIEANPQADLLLKENVPYEELMEISYDPLVLNIKEFECPICLTMIHEGEGVTLKECLHNFCRDCLVQTITISTDAEVKCPFLNEEYSCEGLILQCEVKALVSDDVFQKYLGRGMKLAEAQIKNSVHCKKLDCPGWVIIEDGTYEFTCPACNHGNCIRCEAVHDGLDCVTYKNTLNPGSANSASVKTLQAMINHGTAMTCPTCGVTVVKTEGCAGLMCSLCRTLLCWMTKGPRWGPRGHGDTSGGCRCDIRNGRPCHPQCNNCH